MCELAIQDLKLYQGQIDEDGVFVAVSRQALDETLDYIDNLQAENARLREKNQRLMQAITFKQNECLEKLQQALAPQIEEK